MAKERIKRIPSDYEILENGNDSNGKKPGVKNCNEIVADYLSHSLKRKTSYYIYFNASNVTPIDFNLTPGNKFRIYQNVSNSTEDVIGSILKVRNKSNPWLIEAKIESGNIDLSTLNDEIRFNLNLKYATENVYETVTDVFATDLSSNSARIKWTNPNSKEIEGYAIQYRKLTDITNVNWFRKEIASESLSVIDSLESNKQYEVQVMVIYSGGFSNFSDSFFFKTL